MTNDSRLTSVPVPIVDGTADVQPPAGIEAVSQTLQELLKLIEASLSLLDRGDFVDLFGLDQELAPVLEAIARMPEADARSLLPALETVQRGLDALEAGLRRGQAFGLGEPGTRRIRAVAAYSRPAGDR